MCTVASLNPYVVSVSAAPARAPDAAREGADAATHVGAFFGSWFQPRLTAMWIALRSVGTTNEQDFHNGVYVKGGLNSGNMGGYYYDEKGDIAGQPAIYKARVISKTHNSAKLLTRLHILLIEKSTGAAFTRYDHTLYDLSDFRNWRFSTKAISTDEVNYEEHEKHLEWSQAHSPTPLESLIPDVLFVPNEIEVLDRLHVGQHPTNVLFFGGVLDQRQKRNLRPQPRTHAGGATIGIVA